MMKLVSQGTTTEPIATTLLDLVFALQRGKAATEAELADVAIRLVATRRVKLTGIYRDTDPEQLDAPGTPGRLN
jgi:hypothetical protein